MTFASRSTLIIGAVLLAHACYSAQEFSSILNTSNSASSQPIASADTPGANPYPTLSAPTMTSFSSLPLDITLETIVSVALLCLGIVLGSEELRPISWRVWAGNVEREKGQKKSIGSVSEEGYLWLESGSRKGFLDIRGQRKEFADWVRGQGKS